MITTLVGQSGYTYHAANRDSSAALCRSNLKPRTFMDDTSSTGWTVALRRLPGDPAERADARDAVNCVPCLRKLEKITAEAFDAATAEDPSRTDQTVTPAEIAARTATVAPVAVGSTMWNALVQVRDYGNGLHIANGTLDALVRRGLTEAQDNIRYGYRLTDAGVALVGRKIERPGRGDAAPIVVPVALHMRRADSNLVFRVQGTDNSGRYFGVHLVASSDPSYELDRDLRELEEDGWVACDVEGNVQAATVRQTPPALEPFPNADHLIGERVTLPSADPRQSVGTISGTVARVRPAPRGARHAVAELESGYLVSLSAALVEMTAPRPCPAGASCTGGRFPGHPAHPVSG